MKRAVLVGFLFAAGPVLAQPQPTSVRPDRIKTRGQIAVMEAVLERAVQQGAQVVGHQMQMLTPNVLYFGGEARARGFMLDGYGVFFDVEVPALLRSVTWSFQLLNDQDFGPDTALRSLRQYVRSIDDIRARSELEQAIERLELQVGPITPSLPPDTAKPRTIASGEASKRVASRSVADPHETYVAEVRNALSDAMLDYSGRIPIEPEEWLTVAARDSEEHLTPADTYSSVAFMLRIKGGKLADFRSGRISREEARKLVELLEF